MELAPHRNRLAHAWFEKTTKDRGFRGGRPYNNTELARLGRVLSREVA